MATFNEQQKERNYIRLVRSIAELKSGRKPTDDWEQEYYEYFMLAREHFWNFTYVRPDITDKMFRDAMAEAETYAQTVELRWEEHGRIDHDAYLDMLERMQYSYEYILDDDELTELLNAAHIS
jgi:hypothetical protein